MQRGGNAVDARGRRGVRSGGGQARSLRLGRRHVLVGLHEGRGARSGRSTPADPPPENATIEEFRSRGLDAVPTSGPLSIAVPGAVDGWLELHRQYGTVDLAEVCARRLGSGPGRVSALPVPSPRSIQDLAPSSPDIHRYFREPLEDLTPGRVLRHARSWRACWSPSSVTGATVSMGATWRRACAPASGNAADLFEERDLEGTFAEWMEPLSTDYRGYQVLEQPPVSQGFNRPDHDEPAGGL